MPYKMICRLTRKFVFLNIYPLRDMLRTFSPFTREIYVKMKNKMHYYIQNFMPYKMIYHLPHKFQILNCRLRHFANIFVDYARNIH